MEIILNGEQVTLDHPCTVEGLLEQFELGGRLAVEVNHQIVPRSDYGSHILNDGDRVEIVRAIGGG